MPDFDEYGIPVKEKPSSANVDEYGIPIKKKEGQDGENGGQKPLPFDNSGFVSTLNVNRFNEPEIETENGAKLAVNSRSIPVTPYVNQKDYVQDVQNRIKLGKTTPQDQKFIANVKKANSNFTQEDDIDLSNIAHNYHLPTEYPDIDSKLTAVTQLKGLIEQQQVQEDEQNQSFGGTGGVSTIARNAGVPRGDKAKEIDRLNEIQNKLAVEKNKSDVAPIYMDVAVRTDNSGNLLKKALAGIALLNSASNISGQVATSQQTQDHLEKQPPEFSIGLNGLKYTEPEQYKRVTNMLSKGEPLSESEIATITAQGLDTKQAIIKDAYVKGDLNAEQYQKENDNIQKVRYDNIVNNKETLRAFLSNGIANLADDMRAPLDDVNFNSKIYGHTWNYTDDEIDNLGKTYAQANGIDPNDARVKEAIKYLQDNEGAMIMENSIAKSGYVRDLAKGLASPIRSTFNTIEDIGKSTADIYAASQSAGNVNVAEDRVNRIKNNPIENAVSDVLEGTGQFLTQAGMAAATSGALGVVGKAALGANMGATTAGELVGNVPKLGKMLMGSKDAVSTFVTSYAMAYDPDLRQALTYTSDDVKARTTAGIMASLEGATELFLSPLEIAEGIGKKFLNKKKLSKGILDVLTDEAIVDKNAAVKNFLKSTLHGALETGRVGLAEIGEEEVTQLADYASNAILNPQSKTFQNRDVANEVANTAWQTGLSMALPALASGVGAYKVNNFSKGTLLVAAQNRQQLIDDMNKRLHNGDMSQDEYNQKATIINTAAKANDILPVKDNDKPLDTKEKANYIYSRVSEAVLNRQLKVLEEDKSRSAGKIGEGEDATNVQDPEITQIKKKIEAQVKYRTDILGLKPQYYVDNEPVSKAEFHDILKSPNAAKYDLTVENDNKTQDKLREIGGKDLKVADVTVTEKKEEKTAPVAEQKEVKEEAPAALDIEEEVPQAAQPAVAPLQTNLEAARTQAQTLPVTEAQQPAAVAPVVPGLAANLEAARTNPTVATNTAEQADKRAKELLGEKAPAATVPALGSNLESVRQQQQQQKLQQDLEAQQSASQAHQRVMQIKMDKIPLSGKTQFALKSMRERKGKKKLGIFHGMSESNPRGFLNMVAEQALGITSGLQSDKSKLGELRKQANEKFTKKVVDDAILFHQKLNENDSQNIKGVSSEKRIGEESKQAESKQGSSEKETSDRGMVQITPQEEVAAETEHQKIEDEISSKAKDLTADEVGDVATLYSHSQDEKNPLTVDEAIDFYKNEKHTIPINEEAQPKEVSIPIVEQKNRSDNADMVREILDESSTDKDSNVLTLQEKDNIHSAINNYEAGKISGEELHKAMLRNGLNEKYITKAVIEKLNSTGKEQAVAKEGETITLPSQVQGGIPRIMIFKDGQWQQQVGGQSTVVGANIQALAQQRFEQESKALPDIAINKEDVQLFNDIEKALSVAGKKNQQMALERLYEGKNAKYTKEQVDAAIVINKNFDNIVKDMNKDGLLTKQCPT